LCLVLVLLASEGYRRRVCTQSFFCSVDFGHSADVGCLASTLTDSHAVVCVQGDSETHHDEVVVQKLCRANQ
ncbi:hypothetical protein KCU96_g60, partial [Aureobasidium melanogenum]